MTLHKCIGILKKITGMKYPQDLWSEPLKKADDFCKEICRIISFFYIPLLFVNKKSKEESSCFIPPQRSNYVPWQRAQIESCTFGTIVMTKPTKTGWVRMICAVTTHIMQYAGDAVVIVSEIQ